MASRMYRFMQSGLRVLVRAFFREKDVAGMDLIPEDRGGILVAWHPNGLVDPGLILTSFPGQVVFGARHGLFRWPGLNYLLKGLGTVPIYRASDLKGKGRSTDNQKSLSALADRVAGGSFSALFPEGVSHDLPHIADLKTGVARLYYQARQAQSRGTPPVIIPVGLHYDRKKVFRSRALVWFHEPIELPALLDITPGESEDPESQRERVRALTKEIEHILQDVVHGTDDWELHGVLHRGRKLIRAERAKRAGARSMRPTIEDRTMGFARVRKAYYHRLQTHPEEVAKLKARVQAYDEDLRALQLEDHELDADPKLADRWLFLLLFLQVLGVFLFLPPLILLGYLVNGPSALLLLLITKLGAKKRKDVATIKILVGTILFPLTWIAVFFVGALAHGQLREIYPSLTASPWVAGGMLALFSALGGAAGLRYLHVAKRTANAARVRFTKTRRKVSVARLRVERGELYDRLIELAQGIELPGRVAADGRVTRE